MNGYTGQTAPMMAEDEGGASDNRLLLDPNNPDWKQSIDGWTDGEEYEVTLRIRQNSPGDYAVLSVNTSGGESETENESEEVESESGSSLGYSTPAVAKLMEG